MGQENAKPVEYACTNAMVTFQLPPGLGRGLEDRMAVRMIKIPCWGSYYPPMSKLDWGSYSA